MSAKAGELSDTFNVESLWKYVVFSVLTAGILDFLIFHGTVFEPLLAKLMPWAQEGMKLLQIDHLVNFVAAIVPAFPVDSAIPSGFEGVPPLAAEPSFGVPDAGGGQNLGLDSFE